MISFTFPPICDSKEQLKTEVTKLKETIERGIQQLSGTHTSTLIYETNKPETPKIEVQIHTKNGKCTSLKWVFAHNAFATGPINAAISKKYFSGMEFERRICVYPDPHPKLAWDQWEEKVPQIAAHNKDVIHPKVVAKVKDVIKHLSKQVDILDIGGGNGTLASRLCEIASVKEVVVIHSSDKELPKIEKMIPKKQSLDEIDEKVDIIVLCDVVACKVLTKTNAAALIKKCHGMLRGNGFLIATSSLPSLVNSDEYEEMGFSVHNKVFIRKTPQGHQFDDFYILEKK